MLYAIIAWDPPTSGALRPQVRPREGVIREVEIKPLLQVAP